MYTQADVDAMIKAWMESPAGIQKLRSLGVGVYTPEEMVKIGENLKADLISAFIHIQTSGIGGFNSDAVKVSFDGKSKVSISFSPDSLRRKSLMYVPRTGEKWNSRKTYYAYKDGKRKEYKITKSNEGHIANGIKDVFALFTQGWHAHGYVYGSWEDASPSHPSSRKYGVEIRSRKDYPGNPFISHVINSYMAQYPGLEIKYPSAWGG